MKTFNYLSAEFKRLTKKKSVLVSAIIVILVPLVYAMIMLSPKWGPYDNIDNLPVAVVNNDQGAISDGEKINVGESLVESLQENESLGWDFVSAEEAQRGMDKMKYFMTIEIPHDFSQNVTTVLDDKPIRPELKFTQNEGLHYMAARVTDSAVETIQNQLSTQVTETYVEKVFLQLGEVADGFEKAADGSEQINDGAGKLKDGSDEILSSLTEKSSDISRLADGSKELADGTQLMKDSLVSKQGDISKLADGSKQLNAGTNELKTNLVDKSGDISKLADGSNQLNAGTNELKTNLVDKSGDISKLADGSKQLNAGTNELKTNLVNKSGDISKLADGAKQVNDGTGQLLDALTDKSPDIKRLSDGASELSAGAKELESGASQLFEGTEQAKSGSAQLKDGLENQIIPGSIELADGVQQAQAGVNETIESMQTLHESLLFLSTLEKDHPFYDGILDEVLAGLEAGLSDAPQKQADFQRLVDGANALRDGLQGDFSEGLTALDSGLGEIAAGQSQLKEGATQLADGASQVADGNKTVYAGWNELETNVAKLHDGTTQIKEGNKAVETGWQELTAGATQLDDGASQISEGNQAVESGWQQLTAGATQLDDGASQISEGNQAVESGWQQLTAGATQLDDGASQISEGNQAVESGWQELSAGATKLHDGSTQISDGNDAVETGWNKLTDGVGQVDDGLSKLLDGSKELKTGLRDGADRTSGIDPTEENMTMFAAPVQLAGEVINSFPFYRDSNAPYIITLALFVGILAMSIVIPYRHPAILPPSGMSWFTVKATKLSAFAIAQAVIISLFSLLVLKIEVQSPFMFVLFSIWVSLTFLMIIQFLVVLAGNIGRFIALTFAVLQLSTTGSDLPIHMLPEGLRKLSTFLPFTYSIDGFKNIITLGSLTKVWANIGVLFMYLLLFATLTLMVYLVSYRRERQRFNEETSEVIG